MEQLHIATRHIADEQGETRIFHYRITVNVEECERFAFEHYGISVTEEGGDSILIPAITPSASRIDALMTLLVDGRVGPTTARDVVMDWI